MLIARAFWMMRRSAGLLSGFGPLAFTAIEISLPMRANAFDILSQRANIVALRVSKMRPMSSLPEGGRPRGRRFGGVDPASERAFKTTRDGGSSEPDRATC